jgi:hypothetical protein
MNSLQNITSVCVGALAALTLGAASLAGPGGGYDSGSESSGKCPTRVLVGEDVSSYLCMEPVRASVRLGGQPVMLDVNFSLDAVSRSDRRTVNQRMLYLRAAYTETLLLYAGRIYRPGQVPDADLISTWLQEDTDRLIGEGKARILIDTVLIHSN